jgi:hypothetical protein
MTWLLAGAAAYALLLAGMFAAMSQPPRRFGQFMRRFPMPLMMLVPFVPMWNVARRGRVEVGDQAPDFALPTVDRSSTIRLSSFRGERPVVLIFGSYT